MGQISKVPISNCFGELCPVHSAHCFVIELMGWWGLMARPFTASAGGLQRGGMAEKSLFGYRILLKEVWFHAEIHDHAAIASYCIILPFESKLEENLTVPNPVICGLYGPSVTLCQIVKESMQQTFATSLFSAAGAMVGRILLSCFFKG